MPANLGPLSSLLLKHRAWKLTDLKTQIYRLGLPRRIMEVDTRGVDTGQKKKTSRHICFGHPWGCRVRTLERHPRQEPSPGQRGHRPQSSLGLEVIFTARFGSYTCHAAPQVLLRLASPVDKKQHLQGEGPTQGHQPASVLPNCSTAFLPHSPGLRTTSPG